MTEDCIAHPDVDSLHCLMDSRIFWMPNDVHERHKRLMPRLHLCVLFGRPGVDYCWYGDIKMFCFRLKMVQLAICSLDLMIQSLSDFVGSYATPHGSDQHTTCIQTGGNEDSLFPARLFRPRDVFYLISVAFGIDMGVGKGRGGALSEMPNKTSPRREGFSTVHFKTTVYGSAGTQSNC